MIYCTNCGTESKPILWTKGSFFIELILWLLFIIPGVIYSFWRLSTREKVCEVCKSNAIIPADSPRAQHLKEKTS